MSREDPDDSDDVIYAADVILLMIAVGGAVAHLLGYI